MHRERHPGLAGRRFQIHHLCRVVDAAADPRGMRQRHQMAQLLSADDLVGDEHILDPAIDHRLGFADLLDAHPDRAQLDLL